MYNIKLNTSIGSVKSLGKVLKCWN